MTFRIGSVEIGGDNPCRFVAEISNNHNGDLARAKRLIVAAKDAGADVIKFQCYTPDELVALRGDGPAPEPWGSQGWTMRALYEKAQTPHDWFPHLKGFCEGLGVPWFSSVFGQQSLALLESLDCPAYKIARLDNMQYDLAAAVHATGKPLIVSVSGDDDTAVASAATSVLYCPPGYPQTAFAFAAAEFSPDHMGWHYCDGFSFHGTDPFPCVVAATLGAKVIEAHIQLDDEPSELEANVSLTASAFCRMVDDVRRVEAMLA